MTRKRTPSLPTTILTMVLSSCVLGGDGEASNKIQIEYKSASGFGSILIKRIDSERIIYKLTKLPIITEAGVCDAEGEAIASNVDADYEIDADESGNAFPSVAYIHESDCVVSVRLEVPSEDRAVVFVTQCEAVNQRCSRIDLGVFRRAIKSDR